MKGQTYVISRKALTDIENIWLFTAEKWSVAQADRYYNLIFDEIHYICRHADAGKSMEHVRSGYWAAKVKSHLIFYRVSESVIEIIRVLHERMDIENHLSE